MIKIEALFNITYGLYIVCSGNEKKGNGFVSNTVFQVTSDPPKFAACCNKDNFTTDLIRDSGLFSVSILHTDSPSSLYGTFGYQSGKDIDKFEDMEVHYGETGVPILINDCMAWLECQVVETYDVGTHWLFIGSLVAADVIDDKLDPITYAHYRNVKKGVAPKNAPTYIDKSKYETQAPASDTKELICAACGYIYDESMEDVRFESLPDDWTCPICGADKEDFY